MSSRECLSSVSYGGDQDWRRKRIKKNEKISENLKEGIKTVRTTGPSSKVQDGALEIVSTNLRHSDTCLHDTCHSKRNQ